MLDRIQGLSENQLLTLERLLVPELEQAHESSTRDNLVAFYVTDPSQRVSRDDLRAYVARLLPTYYVPTQILPVESLPRLVNGKIDRHRLAELLGSGTITSKGRPPAAPVERWIAAMWRSALDVEVANAEDNFFDLGGNSLRAIQVLARIENVLGIEFPLVTLFENPTLTGLAEAVLRAGRDMQDLDAVITVAMQVYELSTEEADALLNNSETADGRLVAPLE